MVIWPGFIIKEVNIRSGQEKEIIFTTYYWFYFLYTLLFFSFGFLRLFIKYFRNKGIERSQIIYLATGYSLAANLAFATNLIMPWLGSFFLNWLGQVLTCIMVAFTTYAILKYRLMDIRIVVRKVAVYFLSAGFVYGVFYLMVWFYNKAFGSVYSNGAYLLGLLIAPLFVLLFAWLNSEIKIVANKYLFFSLYSHQETIAKLTDDLTNSIDLSKIVDSIVDSIKEAMQLDRAGILLIDQSGLVIKYKIAKVIGFNENNGISLVQDNFLTHYLQETKKPLVRDEIQIIAKDLKNIEEKQNFGQLSENMKHIEASLCLPMIISSKLIGIIVLGNKVSGDAYTKEDLELLITLSKQASIAIDNARLYKEVQDFNKTLQQKVDEQTSEIRQQKEKVERAFEIEKQAHEELKRVDEAKTQFMTLTQHHLKTPLTSMLGYLDLLIKNEYGKVSVKIKKVLGNLLLSTKNEIKMVNDILDVSGYQIGKEIINLESGVSMESMLEEIVNELDIQAKEKGIYLKIEKLENIPTVSIDKSKIRMALTNIIDNAVKYTTQGGVTISLKSENNKMLISIKDTGIGMSKNLIENLFNQIFHRGQGAQKLFATGKGIGLFLSGKVIEGHNGKIWAESDGECKGSVFYIELPINK